MKQPVRMVDSASEVAEDQDSSETVEGAAEGERERQRDWWSSVERHRARQKILPGLMVGSLLFTVGYGGIALGLSGDDYETWLIGLSALGMLGGTYLTFYFFQRYRLARAEYESGVQAEAQDAVDDAVRTVQEDTSLGNLIALNRRELEQYHAITKVQANTSYLSMQIATGVGLVLIVGGGISAILVKDTTAQIIVGSLSAVGTIIAGYIGRTFLKTYQISLSQMNFYFRAPLVTSYALSAERIATQISDGRRDDVLARIIDRVLDSSIGKDVEAGMAGPAS